MPVRPQHLLWPVPRTPAFLSLMTAFLSLGCPPAAETGPCRNDKECGDYRFCDAGLCLCADDRGCSQGESCNAAFQCQAVAGCRDNSDCQGETFCDITSGLCIGADQCAIDLHCPFGNVCDAALTECVRGCREEGDCALGFACIGAGRDRLGQCAMGICRGNDLCKIQEICDLSSGECIFDDRGPYCGACQNLWSDDECGGGANYCLVDTGDPSGRSYYCGVDCSQGQACPFGYECHDVIILPRSAPLCRVEKCLAGSCSTGGASCTVDQDCLLGPPGGDCPRARIGNCLDDQTRSCGGDDDCCDQPPCGEGLCVVQECRGGEGDVLGHCTCTRDMDCPIDECRDADLSDPENQVAGDCLISGHACYDDIDCDIIACVEGGCMIGQNCAPANDRTCRELSRAREEE